MTVVFYRREMSVHTQSFSSSADKPKKVVADWKRNRQFAALGLSFETFQPIRRADLYSVHDVEYVDGIFSSTTRNGFGNTDPAVARACLYTCGAMVAAARLAAKERRFACAPVSGFHHAGYDFAGGFCTFNGLALAAHWLVATGNRVAILDFDFHYGNGTVDILRRLPGMAKNVLHYTSGDHGLRPDEVSGAIKELVASAKQWDATVILYQAGADMHIDDPLGGLLDDEEMAERDRTLFRCAVKARIPVAWNLAGGYCRDSADTIAPVIQTHREAMRESLRHSLLLH